MTMESPPVIRRDQRCTARRTGRVLVVKPKDRAYVLRGHLLCLGQPPAFWAVPRGDGKTCVYT